MKSIRDFLEGKIRRSEAGDVLHLDTDLAPHPTLGAHEGTLVGPRGELVFHADGCVLAGGAAHRYEELERVVLSPIYDGSNGLERAVDLVFRGGRTVRLAASPRGGEVVHAALRWIGHTRLRRALTD